MKDFFKMNREFKKYLPIFMIMLSIVLLMGTSYALLRSSQQGENTYVMNVGLLEVTFQDAETNAFSFDNMIPMSDEDGMKIEEELEFTVKNTGTLPAKYNVYIEETSTSPAFKTVIRFISNKNDEGYNSPKTLSEDYYIDTMASLDVGETATYKVKVWLDESADSTYMDKTFTARVVVDVLQGNAPAKFLIEHSIRNSTCNPSVTDTDGTIYLSGTNDCVNFNYVWYSGKLWRITALYPDGTMKMITDSAITTINWGEKSTVSDTDLTSAYSTSYMREWLNQEFLPTLYNYENIIVTDAGWYSITDSASTPTKPTGDYTLTAPVGLLNAYEYYMSYQNISYQNGYLNIGYHWWLITPSSSSDVCYVTNGGNLRSGSPGSDAYGGRPVINLKSTIQLEGGNGTVSNPYRIKGDKEDVVANTTLINTRSSGEYIKLEGDTSEQVFRIVDTEIITDSETSEEKLTTKIVLNDYIKESGSILTKSFSGSSSHELWTEVSASDTTYWRGYLNTTWLSGLNTDMLEKGTYYLGYHTTGSYKTTVCSTVSSDISIDGCIENGTVVSNISNEDYVGLLRVGEMFASQTNDYTSSNAKSLWLITPYSSSSMRRVGNGSGLYSGSPYGNADGGRPSINLTSSVVIKSGSGTKQDPFVVGLPS